MNKSYATIVISPNSRNMDGSPIVERTCGHRHRTLSGASRCCRELTKSDKHGMYRADFFRGAVRHADGSPLTEAEIDALCELEN